MPAFTIPHGADLTPLKPSVSRKHNTGPYIYPDKRSDERPVYGLAAHRAQLDDAMERRARVSAHLHGTAPRRQQEKPSRFRILGNGCVRFA